jgi:6-phosphogluconolactonase
MFRIISEDNINKLNKIVVDILVENIDDLLRKKDYVILGIPGGRSVLGIFALLKNEERIPWKKIHIFMIDERIVPICDIESNFKLANDGFIKNLIKKNILPKENVHPFIFKKKADFGLSDYEDELIRYGNFYDIMILSAGEDGHIASLYPKHDSIKNNSGRYLFMEDSPKPPSRRITVSRKMVLKSKVVILLFIGKSKKQAYKKVLDRDDDFYSCPARLVKNVKKLYILTSFSGIEDDYRLNLSKKTIN